MATGEVELVGTLIDSDAGTGGNGPANVQGPDFAKFFDSTSATGGWVGLDAGAACTVTRVRFAPRSGDSGVTSATQALYESRIKGGKFQASTASDFSSGVTDLDTVPTSPDYHRNHFNERAIAGAPSNRYCRYLGPTGAHCNISLLRFIISAGAVDSVSKPVTPVFGIWGGGFPSLASASKTVPVNCPTTSATLYYTTGSIGSPPADPINSDTAASGGNITVPSSAAVVVVKLRAYDASCGTVYSDVVTAYFRPWGWKPNEDWYDDQGNLIEAHSGGILDNTSRDGYYYWFGDSCNRYSHVLPADAANTIDDNGTTGVWCYKSTDLRNWTFVGQMVQNVALVYYERPHVLYNAANNNYIMWWHVADRVNNVHKAGVAHAASPSGAWAVDTTSLDPDGFGSFADCTLFQNPDDATDAYAVYTRLDNGHIVVSKLSSDFKTTNGSNVDAVTAAFQESPVMFKSDGAYILMHSAVANYYDSTSTYSPNYAASTTPLSGWTTPQSTGDPNGTNYNGQLTACVPFQTGVLVIGDYWVQATMYSSRYTFAPLTELLLQPTSWDKSRFNVPSNKLLVGLSYYFSMGELSGAIVDRVLGTSISPTGAPGQQGVYRRGRTISTGNYFSKASATQFQAGSGSFFISFWCRTTVAGSAAAFAGPLTKDDQSSQRDYGFYINSGADNLLYFYVTADGSTVVQVPATTFGAWPANQTVHVFAYYNDSTHKIGLIINGVAEAEVSFTGPAHSGTHAIEIGTVNGGANPWPGYIAEVGLWTKLWTAEEASALYNAGQGLPYACFRGKILFSASSNSGYQTAVSSYTWNHTCNGMDRFLAVDVSLLSVAGTTVTGVTYNGVAMSLIGAQSTLTGSGRVECWGLRNPALGSNAITVTLSAAVASAGTAVSYTGVHQTLPTEGFKGAQATNVGAADATVSITPVADGDWVRGAIATDDTSVTANQTSRNNVSGTLGSGADEDTGPISPPAVTAVSYTGVGALATWAIAGYAIRPVTAPEDAFPYLSLRWQPVEVEEELFY